MKYVKCGRVNTITNGIIDNCIIGIENGKIVLIGSDIQIPDDAYVL